MQQPHCLKPPMGPHCLTSPPVDWHKTQLEQDLLDLQQRHHHLLVFFLRDGTKMEVNIMMHQTKHIEIQQYNNLYI